MSRCRCSSRALEVFIRDFAGLNIRRAPPRQQPLQRRGFGTRPAHRQLETVAAGVDDGFIPFEAEKGRAMGGKMKGEEHDMGDVDGEWHAEIEIQGSWPARTNASVVETGKEDATEEDAGRTIMSETTEADVGAGVPLSGISPRRSIPAAKAPNGWFKDKTAVWENGLSRAENRLLRKQRRMKAGTYAPARMERERTASMAVEEQVENETASVLKQIERLEGPGLEKSMPREKNIKSQGKTRDGREGKKASKSTLEAKIARTSSPASKAATSRPDGKPDRDHETWFTQKSALASKFGSSSWAPSKRVSPDTISGIRALHASDPAQYTTATLSQHFQTSPEAIRRILRSKWQPSEMEADARAARWERRGVRKWGEMASKGMKPPKQWREAGVAWEEKVGARKRPVRRVVRGERGEEEGVGMLNGIELD